MIERGKILIGIKNNLFQIECLLKLTSNHTLIFYSMILRKNKKVNFLTRMQERIHNRIWILKKSIKAQTSKILMTKFQILKMKQN